MLYLLDKTEIWKGRKEKVRYSNTKRYPSS